MRCTAVFLIAMGACGAAWSSGCGGSAAKPVAPSAQTEDQARQDAKAVVDEGYRALKSGDTDDLLSLLSDEVVVLGPRPSDMMRTRADAVLALREVIDPRKKTKFQAGGVKLAIATGGRSAYAVDKLTFGGKPVVATALVDGAAATWRVTAVALAPLVSEAAKKKAASAGTLSAPAATAEVPIGDGGSGPTQALASGLSDVSAWVSALADEPGALVITSDGSVASGKKAIGRAAKQWSAVAMEPTSAIFSVVTGDGKLALVTCLAQRQGKEPSEPTPSSAAGAKGKAKASAKKPAKPAAALAPHVVRVTAILKNAGRDTWTLAVFQEASAIASK